MTREEAPDLQSVLERFDSSERTLEQLNEKLRSLTLAEETTTQASGSLTAAAGAIQEASERLAELAEQATAAQAELRQAVETAAEFLKATDLSELNQTLSDISAQVGQHLPRALDARYEDIEKRLEALEELKAERNQLQSELDAVRNGLSPRRLRKLGLSESG
jgi:chromosome segregation ATPase